MSDQLGTYSFLPWLRLGVANNITAADMDASVKTRAAITVDLQLTGQPLEGETPLTATVSRDVALYGPGDIVGLDQRAIVKVEPRNYITNFEPNYLPYIEFYDEDFPWRYTPAAPDTSLHRLRPWIALLVMREDEFKDAPVLSSRPLSAIEVTAAVDTVFPPTDQLWAWAHVHVNRDLIKQDGVTISTDGDAAGARLESLLKANPDHAYSRILSQRRLQANAGYHAFLVPSFESGRLAGLGLDPEAENPARFATQSAWAEYADRPLPGLYPIYKRWYFKTGDIGDFEYLVRLLKPRPPDSRLGRRDMDVQTPGSNLGGIENPALQGVLRLGGALKVPDEALSDAEEQEAALYENWDDPFPHPFQTDLANFINLADDYERQGDPDPLITPTLYGRWHALTTRLLTDEDGAPLSPTDNWIHEDNLDPRFRVPSGFGTRVIQDNQEEYMDAAWEQVGDVIAANRRIRLAQLAKEATFVWHRSHVAPLRDLSAERALVLTAPVQRRVIAGGRTVRHQLTQSTVPTAALSAPFRRVLRPRDHVATRLGFGSPKGAEELIAKINTGKVSAAPPRVTPEDLPTLQEVSDALKPDTPFGTLISDFARYPWIKWLLLLIGLFLALLLALSGSVVVGLVLAFATVLGFVVLRRLERQQKASDAVLPEGNAPEVIDALPNFPGFTIRDPDPNAPEPEPGPGPDSPEAARFKLALKDTFQLIDASAALGEPPVRRPINIPGLTTATFTGIDPQVTIPAFTYAGITIPAHLVAINFEVFREAMAYPEFDIPMYEPLLGLSDEHFLPNIDKIPPNTITLLETNQRFIEAYMLGLNVEFASELLWREYPTDQRGSYFRQFWDPSGVIDREGLSKDELREKLRDIPPIHIWSRSSKLGDHDHREAAGDNEEEVVLVIRGELLKKYPTAVIYAQKARWQTDDAGAIDPSLPREFEVEGPEASRLRTPLYEAKVDPDITFLGFDLTADEVQGGSGQPGDTESGWFFVIKERPGEPRFGLDIDSADELNVWNDLAWADVFDPDTDNGFLQVGSGPTLTLEEPPDTAPEQEKLQHGEDVALSWRPNTNAAELAYILYQVPVLVAVHGSEMLPK
jgi:hypothetical protein